MQLDHFFILTEKFAPEAELLTDLGLVEGTSNSHPGQGTANRRFFFANTALELLYVRDAKEANEGPGQGLRLPERASSSDASPFGFIMRCDGDSDSTSFAGWRYQPMYFDPGISFLVAENSERLEEPLCICLPDDPPSGLSQARSEMPFMEVTELQLHVPVDEPSAALKAIAQVEGIRVQTHSPHLLIIAFGHETEGQRRDLRPRLPLVICW
jgi:hypothetical protein